MQDATKPQRAITSFNRATVELSFTTSQGILTITNGSVIASELPQGLIFTSSNGTEIRTDSRIFVPVGSANGYGNIPAYAINRVEGISMYIRNLQPFAGGRDAYSVPSI